VSVSGVAGKGKLIAGALEMSNVDLTEQFTDMIVTQRGFQANSKTIQTSDTLLETVLSLKR
jgi:flagellar hook protein FlgE